MMQKPYVIERKDWLDAVAAVLWPHKLIEQLRNTFEIAIPEGYQDEKGFHFGVQPDNAQK